MSLNLKSLIYLLFMMAVAVAVALVAVALRPVQAHLADRPELDNWAMELSSANGMCCDGSDAEPIKDADWDASTDGKYRVKINGEWIDVPPDAVVPSGNRYGQTLVWGYPSINGNPSFFVRCFLPGAGG